MSDKFILNEKGNPVPENDLFKWGQWMQTGDRKVARETINGIDVSTVFLGLDHNYENTGCPILWETMTFGKIEYQDRCGGSREQAEAMHAKMVQRIKEETKNEP